LEKRGFAREDFAQLCLSVHYRRPLDFSWARLAEARAERGELLAAGRAAAEVSLAPHPAALSGYLLRFRSELARDLDLPGALACVRDGLRPGALSPGSRAALVRETFPALGLPSAASGAGH
jgi:cysteinyl-tRNA synthetase